MYKENLDFESSSRSPWYNPAIWQDIGQSILVSLLDYDHINPISRLVKAQEDNLGEAVEKIRQEIRWQTIDKRQA